jgi:hypothetical protein
MPTLKMYISKILIDQVRLDYENMLSSTEKEEYHMRIVDGMKQKHYFNIKQATREAVFFVEGLQSKMNDAAETVEGPYPRTLSLSDKDAYRRQRFSFRNPHS